MRWSGVLLVALGCVVPPEPPPSQAAAAADVDRATLPPLYRKLYDYAFLPKVQEQEQAVRLKIWLRYMKFDRYQLGLLDDLVAFTRREFEAVSAKQTEIVSTYEPQVAAVYEEIDAAQARGATEDELGALAAKLEVIDRRQGELLELRSASVRTILDREQAFLGTLTPKQDTLFADAIFALRHRLDPWANPGDFHELVGSVYVAGEFGTLTRPTYTADEDNLNIGGLWSPEPEKLTGPYFQDARREVILYMLLLEPALPGALAAVSAERAQAGDAATPAAGSPGSPPPDGGAIPGSPPTGPGAAEAPAPVQAPAPEPVKAPDPAPAPAGSPPPP